MGSPTIGALIAACSYMRQPTTKQIAVAQDVWDTLAAQAAFPSYATAKDRLLGMPIIIDASLAPGEWRLVPHPSASPAAAPGMETKP